MKQLFLFIPFIVLLCTSNVYGQITETEKIETIQLLPADFQDFFRQFFQNYETQITLIKTPLLVRKQEYHSNSTELFNKKKLQEKWGFINEDFFIENFIIDEEWCGYWLKTDDTHITYEKALCEADFSIEFHFKKSKNKWFLTKLVFNNY